MPSGHSILLVDEMLSHCSHCHQAKVHTLSYRSKLLCHQLESRFHLDEFQKESHKSVGKKELPEFEKMSKDQDLHKTCILKLSLTYSPLGVNSTDKSAPQGSHSFTAYTISKEQYDSWEWYFMKLWYNQSDQHARILLASRARVLRFALTKIFEKISASQSTRNALKRIEMQKKFFYPFDRLRTSRVAQCPSGVAQWNFNTINRT